VFVAAKRTRKLIRIFHVSQYFIDFIIILNFSNFRLSPFSRNCYSASGSLVYDRTTYIKPPSFAQPSMRVSETLRPS